MNARSDYILFWYIKRTGFDSLEADLADERNSHFNIVTSNLAESHTSCFIEALIARTKQGKTDLTDRRDGHTIGRSYSGYYKCLQNTKTRVRVPTGLPWEMQVMITSFFWTTESKTSLLLLFSVYSCSLTGLSHWLRISRLWVRLPPRMPSRMLLMNTSEIVKAHHRLCLPNLRERFDEGTSAGL